MKSTLKGAVLCGFLLIGAATTPPASEPAAEAGFASHIVPASIDPTLPGSDLPGSDLPGGDLPAFVERGLAWLAAAQYENGGWGAGSHQQQQNRNPRAVQVDPATTAYAALALMHAGSTLTDGAYQAHVGRALGFLLAAVEAVPEGGTRLATVQGTQPQAKLGQNIDLAMTAQFLTEVLPFTTHDAALRARTGDALERCITLLTRLQDADGSWNTQGGWAGVLQSAMANNALEMAQDAGVAVDEEALRRSRKYQKSNVDAATGRVETGSAAGISLYAIASNQRATAQEAREAETAVAEGVRKGTVTAPSVTAESLQQLGYDADDAGRLADAYQRNQAAAKMVQRDDVLAGFGNNGGEEFLSYMMTSESLVATDAEAWQGWYQKMHRLLAKVQNPDGSWSGHHCITSPVFCTAAVIMTLTADRLTRAE